MPACQHSAIIGFKQGTRADFKVKRVIIWNNRIIKLSSFSLYGSFW